MTIFLLRHGATDWTLAGRHNGRTDTCLNELGRKQALTVRPHLEEVIFDAVICSPLQRALETAKLALPDYPSSCDYRLLEWNYGDYEGLTVQEIRRDLPAWSPWTYGFPKGEAIADVAERARRFSDELSSYGNNIVLVGHGHWLRLFAVQWLGFPPLAASRLALDPGRLSVLDGEYETPAIRRWNLA